MADASELAGKVALATGGARNIGRAICCALAAGGAAVMVNARNSQEEAEQTVALIRSAGGRAQGRRGEPDEVAGTVRFLRGPGARYITGQSLHVNGGGYMA